VVRGSDGLHGEFSLVWAKPVEVAEIVYFGRTGQLMEECFKDYEVYLDDVDRSVPDNNYQIYTVNIDGTGLKRLTDGESNNLVPSWLPDGGIVFISDRKPAYAYCYVVTSPVVFQRILKMLVLCPQNNDGCNLQQTNICVQRLHRQCFNIGCFGLEHIVRHSEGTRTSNGLPCFNKYLKLTDWSV